MRMICQPYTSPQDGSQWTIAVLPDSDGNYIFSVEERAPLGRPMTPDDTYPTLETGWNAAVAFIERTVTRLLEELQREREAEE